MSTEEIIRALARAIAPEVARLLREDAARPERLPHTEWATGHSARRNAELARTGEIRAVRVGRRWLAAPADVAAYVERVGRMPSVPPAPSDVDLVVAARGAARRAHR